MSEHRDLSALLRRALPPVEDRPPSRDLWPRLLDRRPPSPDWTWLDLATATAIAVLLTLFPKWLWLLLYNL